MTPRDDGLVRDRDGDLVPAVVLEPHRCDRGWLGEHDGHPVPCLTCRPHLAPRTPTALPAALAERAASLQATLTAAGPLGTKALTAAKEALGARADRDLIGLLVAACYELDDLRREQAS